MRRGIQGKIIEELEWLHDTKISFMGMGDNLKFMHVIILLLM